jgi:hypothetical protein
MRTKKSLVSSLEILKTRLLEHVHPLIADKSDKIFFYAIDMVCSKHLLMNNVYSGVFRPFLQTYCYTQSCSLRISCNASVIRMTVILNYQIWKENFSRQIDVSYEHYCSFIF